MLHLPHLGTSLSSTGGFRPWTAAPARDQWLCTCAPAQPASPQGWKRPEVLSASSGHRIRIQLENHKPGAQKVRGLPGVWAVSLALGPDPALCSLSRWHVGPSPGPSQPRAGLLFTCEMTAPSRPFLTGPVWFCLSLCTPLSCQKLLQTTCHTPRGDGASCPVVLLSGSLSPSV